MSPQKNKNMNIDDLAAMMSREFERTRAELKTEFKLEINRLELRMARFEYQLDEIKELLNKLQEVDISDLQKRVQYLEQELKHLKKIASK